MPRLFTADLSDIRIRSIFRAPRFGNRTCSPECGYARKLWQLEDGRWRCKRFGLLTDTWPAHHRFELAEIYELLFWFELELTGHGIARRLEVPYHRVHRFLLDLRPAIAAFKDHSSALLDGAVEVDETYFGPRLRNRRRADRQKLRKSRQALPGRRTPVQVGGLRHLRAHRRDRLRRADGQLTCDQNIRPSLKPMSTFSSPGKKLKGISCTSLPRKVR